MGNPFESVDLSTTNLFPLTSQDIHHSEPTNFEHEIMYAYLKENVPAFEDYYVGFVCNKPRNEFIPRLDVVKGQMVIVQ